MTRKVSKKKGISLVIALIMMTLLLSISFSISNIILRQIRLANVSTNSQLSFYAADSALECALYWDTKTDGTVEGSIDGTVAVFGSSTSAASAANRIVCGAYPENPLGLKKSFDVNTQTASTTFEVAYGSTTCASVEVLKSPYRTRISVNGYNTGMNADATGCNLTDAIGRRIVERGLLFTH
ncbi:MAG: hypothetical protein V4576_02525 [Patescibacteria group bacterium]